MYPHVISWLHGLLSSKFKRARVSVYDTSKKVLSRFLFEKGLHKKFPEYQTYEIEVDITGVIEEASKTSLALVECKLASITLRDLSQLLGYSKVANPLISLIVSPAGISESLNMLFNVHRRDDILYYSHDRYIRVAKWVESKIDLDLSSLIPKGTTL